jgi:hypothetical protein
MEALNKRTTWGLRCDMMSSLGQAGANEALLDLVEAGRTAFRLGGGRPRGVNKCGTAGVGALVSPRCAGGEWRGGRGRGCGAGSHGGVRERGVRGLEGCVSAGIAWHRDGCGGVVLQGWLDGGLGYVRVEAFLR